LDAFQVAALGLTIVWLNPNTFTGSKLSDPTTSFRFHRLHQEGIQCETGQFAQSPLQSKAELQKFWLVSRRYDPPRDGLRVFLILRQLESRQGFQPRGAASEGAEGAFVFDSASNERSTVHVLC